MGLYSKLLIFLFFFVSLVYMENLFRKKSFGEDDDNILTFHIKKMNVNSIYKLQNLCSRNPDKCSKIRPELCKKMFALSGYPKIPENACKMYINIVNLIKFSKKLKKNTNISIKPDAELLMIISVIGDDETKKFFNLCGYELPVLFNKKITKIIQEETPTIKIKKSTERKLTIKR